MSRIEGFIHALISLRIQKFFISIYKFNEKSIEKTIIFHKPFSMIRQYGMVLINESIFYLLCEINFTLKIIMRMKTNFCYNLIDY
jgi:hypothetical protein